MRDEHRILGIDLGGCHIGCAVSIPSQGIMPLNEFQYENIYQLQGEIGRIIEEYDVSVVVVGDMGADELPRQFQKLLRRLEDQFGIKTVSVSEHLTSFAAEKQYESHSAAAALIVKEYLEE